MLSALLSHFAAPACTTNSNFFAFPTWYKYLGLKYDTATGRCEVPFDLTDKDFSDISLIALALVDIALRVAALVALGYIIYGGIQFVSAQGASDQTKKARQTIINAIIGLIIALMAAGIVAFIGARIG